MVAREGTGGRTRVPSVSRGCECTARPALAAMAASSGVTSSIHSNDWGISSSRCGREPGERQRR